MKTIMRSFVAASVVLSASLAAQAADLPQPPPPPQAPVAYIPPPEPVYNWGGVYVGVNGGWGWGNGKWTANTVAGNLSANANDNGGIIGGTLGFNYQMNAFVFGVEGDWDWSGMNTGTTGNVCTYSGTCQSGNNWLSTLRGRFGWAADRVLFYGTAGGAFANVQTTFNGNGVNTTHTQAGWTAGVGAEAAFAPNWTAKIEYLYVNLGTGSVTCSSTKCTTFNASNGPIPVSIGLTENLIRVGVNYKFNF